MKACKYNIRHFKSARVVFCDRDKNVVEQTYGNSLRGINKGLRFFCLDVKFPLINIFIAPNRKEYDRFVAHLTEVPTGKGRLGQPQGQDLYLISPNAWPSDVHPDYLGANGACDKKVYRQFIGHEIVHMIEEHISPKGAMEIRPQWWSEGLAVYATGQYKDRITAKCIKEDLSSGRLPGIDGLKGRDAYVWGWSLVCHIGKRFGRKKLTEIMTQSCTADISGFLNVGEKNMEREWRRALPKLVKEII